MTFKTIEISDPQFEFEGFRFITVKSPSLKGRVDVSVYIPEKAKNQQDVPVIFLLHGVYSSHWAWSMKGGAHKKLNKLIEDGNIRPFILVMPSDGLWGDGSGYVQHVNQDFQSWIGDELPALTKKEINHVSKNSSFYIAGLSMGGYGAIRIGSIYSHIFSGISGHSSVTNIKDLITFVEEDWSFWNSEKQLDSIYDVIVANKEGLPPIRFDCGTEDELLQPNRYLHENLTKLDVKHLYEEFPGGHDWNYWNEQVERTFKFFNEIDGNN